MFPFFCFLKFLSLFLFKNLKDTLIILNFLYYIVKDLKKSYKVKSKLQMKNSCIFSNDWCLQTNIHRKWRVTNHIKWRSSSQESKLGNAIEITGKTNTLYFKNVWWYNYLRLIFEVQSFQIKTRFNWCKKVLKRLQSPQFQVIGMFSWFLQ